MHLLESGEMYLESIYILSKKGKLVRAIDICEYLGYSKPSVSRAMSILKKGGYVEAGKDSQLILTRSGLEIAHKIHERHTLLTEFLMSLGVDEQTAADDACKIEHYISDKSFEAIKKHTNK